MRRISTTLCVSLGALLGIVAVAAPAGAAPQPGRAMHPHLGIPSSSRPLITSSVPPLSTGLRRSDRPGRQRGLHPGYGTAADGHVQFDHHPARRPVVARPGSRRADHAEREHGQPFPAPPCAARSTVPATPGACRSPATNGCGGVQAGDFAAAEIDQLTETAGTITSAAVLVRPVGRSAGPYITMIRSHRLQHRPDDTSPGLLHL